MIDTKEICSECGTPHCCGKQERLQNIRNSAIEECAKLTESFLETVRKYDDDAKLYNKTLTRMAEEIRKLKGQGNENETRLHGSFN